MLKIEILANIRNTETAVRALRSFAEDPSSDPLRASDNLDDADAQQLIARLPKNPNRNVFLWLLDVILEITAPVYWWIQIGQYDVDVFTVRRQDHDDSRLLAERDFEGLITKETLAVLNNYIRDGHPELALNLLPTNFIQRGYIKVSYKSLRDIFHAEDSSTNENWARFHEFIQSLPYSELITDSR